MVAAAVDTVACSLDYCCCLVCMFRTELFLSQVNVNSAWDDREQLFAPVVTTSNCCTSVSGCVHTIGSDIGSLELDLGGLAWNEDCI